MKKVIIYCLLLVLVFGCSELGKPKKPDNLIPEKDMVAILVDLAVLSSAKGVNKMTLQNNGISPEEYVYKTHKIDSLQFLNSNNYYAYKTENYEAILKRVEDSLKSLKSLYQIEVEELDTKTVNVKTTEVKKSSTDSIRKKSRKVK